MADENRNFGMREHLRGHAAEHYCRNPAPSVRGHDDEIAPSPLGGLDDAFVRMVLFDLHRFARHTRGTRLLRDAIQYLLCVRLGALGMLGKRVRHLIDPRRRNRVDIEGCLHGQCCDLCPDCFGKGQSMSHCPAGKLRTVGWNQNMPVHAVLSIAPVPPHLQHSFRVIFNLQGQGGGQASALISSPLLVRCAASAALITGAACSATDRYGCCGSSWTLTTARMLATARNAAPPRSADATRANWRSPSAPPA